MAQGLPNIDNTLLDPEGQILGQVNPIGAYIDILTEIVLPISSKANITVFQSKDFLSSLKINLKKLFSLLNNRLSF
jgi:hypothetical protein